MDVFLGQLLLVGFNFAPVSWAPAAGQLLPISSNTALFSLLGTYYGGNGTSNFQLPNLQGACAIGFGNAPGLSDYVIGETGGVPVVTLNRNEVPNHTHLVMAKSLPASQSNPEGNVLGETAGVSLYSSTLSPSQPQPMAAGALGQAIGGGQPHNNQMPFLALNWIICMQGIFPQRQ